jgi:hypothetical protein
MANHDVCVVIALLYCACNMIKAAVLRPCTRGALSKQLRRIPPQGPRQTPTEEKMKQSELERLDKPIYPSPARKRDFKRIAWYALFAAAMAVAPPPAWADPDTPIGSTPSFFKLDNKATSTSINCSALMTTKSSLAISAAAPLSSTMGTF